MDMEYPIAFTAALAGVPFTVFCRFPQNKTFFADYLSDGEPRFSVAPEEKDLLAAGESYLRTMRAEGKTPLPCSEPFLENLALHALIAEEMLAFDTLLMHGSAVALDGEVFLFTAESGVGKSTHTRLWRETFGDRAFALNDDKPLLAVREDGVFACGTPWCGKHGLNRNAVLPLRAVAWLTRGQTNTIRPLSPAEAIPTLFSQCYRSESEKSMEQILRLEDALLRRVPFFKLACTVSPEAVRVAYEGMTGREWGE